MNWLIDWLEKITLEKSKNGLLVFLPFTLKQDMMKRLIKRCALDFFYDFKKWNEVIVFISKKCLILFKKI